MSRLVPKGKTSFVQSERSPGRPNAYEFDDLHRRFEEMNAEGRSLNHMALALGVGSRTVSRWRAALNS